jgi:hypothetical protein
VPLADDGGGSTVHWATCSFFGAGALVMAYGKRPEIRAEEFDYGREHGYGTSMICKADKPIFNNMDANMVNVYLAATNISGL